MPTGRNQQVESWSCRGRLTLIVNLGLCCIGAVFITIGVLRSTLLLYVGCAFIGAAIGGFIRSRLPVHNMVPLHMMYRSDLQRMHAFNNGAQTFVLLRPKGVTQSVINANTTVKAFSPIISHQTAELKDDSSLVSSIFEIDDCMCIICLASIQKNQQIRQLRCNHFYHVQCIDKWLRINELCPTCRVSVKSQIECGKQKKLPYNEDQDEDSSHDVSEVTLPVLEASLGTNADSTIVGVVDHPGHDEIHVEMHLH